MSNNCTITGTILDLSGNPVTSGQVVFTLCPSVDTTLSGTGRFVPGINPVAIIKADGTVTASDGSPFTVVKNTALTPVGTYYQVEIQPNSAVSEASFTFYAISDTVDISTVTPTPTGGPFNYNPAIQGLSAYQLAVNGGYVGTEAQWIASLEGDPGPPQTFLGPYNSGTTYAEGQAVYASDGSSYVSLINANVGHDPTTSPSQWGISAAAGQVTNAALSTSMSLAVSSVAQTGKNLVNPAGWGAGFIDISDGSISVDGTHTYSPLIPANSGGQMVSGQAISNIAGITGISFYDVAGNFIPGMSIASVAANTPFSVPSTAFYLRYTVFVGVILSTLYVGNGTTVPNPQPSYNSYSAAEVNALLSTVNATASSNLALSVQLPTLAIARNAERSANRNLLDPGKWTGGYIDAGTGAVVDSGSNLTTYMYSALIPVTPGLPYLCNQEIDSIGNITGLAYFALDGVTFVSGVQAQTNAATPFTPPANAAYLRFSLFAGDVRFYWVGEGTTLPSPLPSFTVYSSVEIDAKVTALEAAIAEGVAQPFSGKLFVPFGDSYTDLATFSGIWQTKVCADLGMTLGTTYAKSSRTWSPNAVSPGGATNWALSDFYTSGAFDPTKLATALASADVVMIVLGTNDCNGILLGQLTLGTPADAASISSGTSICANIRYVLDAIATANPLVRVFGIGPILVQQANGQAWGIYANRFTNAIAVSFTDAAQAVFADFGFPFFRACDEAGFNGYNGVDLTNGNPNMLQDDGLHPSTGTTGGFNTLYAPYIEGKMLGFRPR